MNVFSIPGKLDVTWNGEVKAIVDTWTDYAVTLEDFSDAVLNKGLSHAKVNGGVAWIVDSSKAVGVFSDEIQAYIGTDIFPAFAANGIKYFITINSEVSSLTKMTVRSYAAKTGPHGLQLVEVASADDGVMWLKENA